MRPQDGLEPLAPVDQFAQPLLPPDLLRADLVVAPAPSLDHARLEGEGNQVSDEVEAEDVVLAAAPSRDATVVKGPSYLWMIVAISLAAALVVVGIPLFRVIRKGAEN